MLLSLLRVPSALVSVSLVILRLHGSTDPHFHHESFPQISSWHRPLSLLIICLYPLATYPPLHKWHMYLNFWRHMCPAKSRCSYNVCWSTQWWLVSERENGKTETCTYTGFLFDPSLISFNNLFSAHFLLWLVLYCFLALYFIFLPVLFSHLPYPLTGGHILFLLFLLWKISKAVQLPFPHPHFFLTLVFCSPIHKL